jgi:glycosyltransferase involved in cell wall biosynthesis
MTAPVELVSVIVPVHNAARFLPDALASVAAQDYPEIETIVVDDGSTDGSGDIAESTPDVRCIRQERQGPAAARNTAVASSTGAFLAFLDADDLLPSTKLIRQVGYLRANPDIGCVLGRQELRVEPGIELPAWAKAPGAADLIAPMSMVVRRRAFDIVGPFDEALGRGRGGFAPGTAPDASDGDWQLRLRETGVGVAVLDEVVLFRRLHGGNLTYDAAGLRRANFEALRARAQRRRRPR